MPTGRTFARPLLIRRVTEPSRDQQALLAQTYERLIGTPVASPRGAGLEPATHVEAPTRHPSGSRESPRPEFTLPGGPVG
jgi:hypothetical protein